MKTVLAFIISSVILVAASHGQGKIEDLKTQLAGTTWKAVPTKPLRGGLAAELTFTPTSVEPAGYRYDIQSSDTLKIAFNHGDTQTMTLSEDGRHLEFALKEKHFAYELISKDDKKEGDLSAQLVGFTWRAIGHTRPGLAATLTFSKDTVAPAGYKYEVNAADSLTIHFNHGDTQLVVMSPGGKRLTAIFKDQKYEYERLSN